MGADSLALQLRVRAEGPEVPVDGPEDQVNLVRGPIIRVGSENQEAGGVSPDAGCRLVRMVPTEGEEGAVDHRPGSALLERAVIDDQQAAEERPVLDALRFERGDQFGHGATLVWPGALRLAAGRRTSRPWRPPGLVRCGMLPVLEISAQSGGKVCKENASGREGHCDRIRRCSQERA